VTAIRAGVAAAGNPRPAPDVPLLPLAPAGNTLPVPVGGRELAVPGPPPARRKRRTKEPPAVLVLFGIRFTWPRLAVAAVVLLAVVGGLGTWAWLTSGLRPNVEPVDAYLAVEHVPQIADYTPGAALSGREPAGLLVTRPNYRGRHLLISFSLSQKLLDEHFGTKVMLSNLSSTEVHLVADGEKVKPLFLTDALPAKGFVVNYLLGGDGPGGGLPLGLPVLFGAPPESAWQHEGELARLADNHSRFQGKGGMEVEMVRADRPQRRVTVTWDSKSRGWLGVARAGNPNNVMGGWEVTCAFPRPAVTKQFDLVVLGRTIPLDRRHAALPE
jgi:hypothetical protein